MMRAENITD